MKMVILLVCIWFVIVEEEREGQQGRGQKGMTAWK
jgi:hypothetical protein